MKTLPEISELNYETQARLIDEHQPLLLELLRSELNSCRTLDRIIDELCFEDSALTVELERRRLFLVEIYEQKIRLSAS